MITVASTRVSDVAAPRASRQIPELNEGRLIICKICMSQCSEQDGLIQIS